MIYHNIPLTGSLQLPMQILQGRSARSDLPMSNAARKQIGIQPEVIRNIDKHKVLPTHHLHVGQSVMIVWLSDGTQLLSQAYVKKREVTC